MTNIDKFFTELVTSENDINNACKCLTDIGYKLSIKANHIPSTGHIKYKPKKKSSYYPTLEIELKRDDVKYKDVRETLTKFSLDTLKDIQNVCNFFSSFSSDDVSVFLSMKDINEINIRISFSLEEIKYPIDFQEVFDFIILRDIKDEYYKIDKISFERDDEIFFDIKAKGDQWLERFSYRELITRITNSDSKDDKKYLMGIYNSFINEIYNECKRNNQRVVIKGDEIYDRWGNKLIEFKCDIEVCEVKDVTVTDDGKVESRINVDIFKDKKEKITIDSMKITIKLLR